MWALECVCGCEAVNLQLLEHYTCGTLLELLIFLFPPLPGLEDAPQGGQLAVTSDGRSVDAGHQATCPQHPLLVHQLYYSDRGDGEVQGDEMGVRKEGVWVCGGEVKERVKWRWK